MTDRLTITKLNVSSQSGLLAPVQDDSKIPRNHTMAQIIKYLDTAKDTTLPKEVRDFFEDTKQQSKVHFSLTKKLLDPANRTISVITDKTKEDKIMFFAKPEEKKYVIGSHRIEKEVEDLLNVDIAAIRLKAAKDIQAAILNRISTDLVTKIQGLSIEDEIALTARKKWTDLQGGPGKFNFLDTYHLVTRQRTLDVADSSPAAAAGSGSISLTEKILLSDAVFSYALLCARQENAIQATELQRIAAEKEEADKTAAALKTAASAAAAARPSPATEESIKKALKAELLAELRKELQLPSGNQRAAGRSQNQQRPQTANQQGQDPGSGAGRGRGAPPARPPQNAPQAGSGGRGGKATRPQPATNPNQDGGGHQQKSNSGSGQSPSHHNRRSSQSPARSQGGSSGPPPAPKSTKRSPSPRRPSPGGPPAANASRGKQQDGKQGEQGKRDRGRNHSPKRSPRAPQ